ncbi:MAG: PAS domain S-box protein, partial [Acidobacteria bacterium]|nr:PAS domain S-box protein [Acidobacteriota bacterium]
MVPLALIHNFSLLLSLSLLSGLLMRWFLRRGSSYTLLMGLLFGAATLVGMSTPVIQQPGLIFDGRSIVLGIAGLFGGPLVAGIAATMAATYRIQIGGPGALMGVLVILESSLLGIGGYYFRQRRKERVGPLTLLTLGLAIHVVMLALLLSLPGGLRLETLQRWGLIILFGYPLAFMVVGLAFLELERHFLTEEALRASEERHRGYVENAPDGVFITDDSGAYLDVNQAACKITGYSRDELLTKHIPDLLHPDSLEVGLKHFASLMEKGSASG